MSGVILEMEDEDRFRWEDGWWESEEVGRPSVSLFPRVLFLPPPFINAFCIKTLFICSIPDGTLGGSIAPWDGKGAER